MSVEAGIGWVPYFLEQMDDRYERNRHWAKVKLERGSRASYVRSNWRFTFVIDHYGVRNRHAVGVENVMWSTDYPHHGCDWPHSRAPSPRCSRVFRPAERRAITYGNCARLYGIRVGEGAGS